MIRKHFILLFGALIMLVNSIMASRFKNSPTSSDALGGLVPFIETLVLFGLSIGIFTVIRDFMMGKDKNPFKSALKWIIALTVWLIVKVFIF